MQTKVFIVDGHDTMRVGLKSVLTAVGMRVVGDSKNAEDSLPSIEAAQPDLVILGLNPTGEVDGIELCQRIKAACSSLRVLIHTAYNFPDDLASCYLAGADGFVHKSIAVEELLDAVRCVASGQTVWLPGERVGEPRSHIHTIPDGPPLTPRQREVLALVLRRYSHAEIAETLHIGIQTAKNHVADVRRKFGAKSSKELRSRNLALPGLNRT